MLPEHAQIMMCAPLWISLSRDIYCGTVLNVVSIRPTEYSDMKSSPQEPRKVGCGGSELDSESDLLLHAGRVWGSNRCVNSQNVLLTSWRNAVEDCIDNNWT